MLWCKFGIRICRPKREQKMVENGIRSRVNVRASQFKYNNDLPGYNTDTTVMRMADSVACIFNVMRVLPALTIHSHPLAVEASHEETNPGNTS